MEIEKDLVNLKKKGLQGVRIGDKLYKTIFIFQLSLLDRVYGIIPGNRYY